MPISPVSRYVRDTVILAKPEVTYGTDSIPTGAANAIAVSNVSIKPLEAQFVDRDLLRNYFGASEQLVAQYNKSISFEVEAVGSGAAGTAPGWGPLLRACAFAETLTVAERVTYTPVTNSQESVSMYVYDSGVLHKLLGVRGAVTISVPLSGIPKLKFSFIGIDGGDSAAAPAGVSFAGFMLPQVASNAFTGPLTLGCALAAPGAAPSLTGGTQYASTGLDVDLGVKAEYVGLIGAESVDVTDRRAKGKIKIAAAAADEIALYATIKAGSTQGLGIIHGTTVGNRFGVFAPAAQIITPNKGEQSGKRMMEYDVVFAPSAAGNDEIQIVTSF
jgi:hypothetical protein